MQKAFATAKLRRDICFGGVMACSYFFHSFEPTTAIIALIIAGALFSKAQFDFQKARNDLR